MEKRDKMPTIFQKKNRTGSHVGMILSFIIFITFVVFLYTVIKPAVNTGEDKTTTLEYIGGKITENVSTNLTSVKMKIVSGKNPNSNCIQLQNFLAFLDIRPPYPVIVKNETGGIEEAYSGSGAAFANLVINRRNKNNLFFEIDFSPVFNGLSVNTIPSCVETRNYNISLVRTEVYVFERNMYKLIEYYKTNYEDLRNELKVPPGNEFGFVFKQSNGTVIEVGGKGVANIYAKEIPIQYFDDKATVQSGFINVRVW
jgi:hypothetical protein